MRRKEPAEELQGEPTRHQEFRRLVAEYHHLLTGEDFRYRNEEDKERVRLLAEMLVRSRVLSDEEERVRYLADTLVSSGGLSDPDRVLSQDRTQDTASVQAAWKGGKSRGEIIRLSIDVSPELNETLEALARKIHSSKSDVLRKAIALMDVAVKAKEDKKKFGVAAAGQTLETEIVGL